MNQETQTVIDNLRDIAGLRKKMLASDWIREFFDSPEKQSEGVGLAMAAAVAVEFAETTHSPLAIELLAQQLDRVDWTEVGKRILVDQELN